MVGSWVLLQPDGRADGAHSASRASDGRHKIVKIVHNGEPPHSGAPRIPVFWSELSTFTRNTNTGEMDRTGRQFTFVDDTQIRRADRIADDVWVRYDAKIRELRAAGKSVQAVTAMLEQDGLKANINQHTYYWKRLSKRGLGDGSTRLDHYTPNASANMVDIDASSANNRGEGSSQSPHKSDPSSHPPCLAVANRAGTAPPASKIETVSDNVFMNDATFSGGPLTSDSTMDRIFSELDDMDVFSTLLPQDLELKFDEGWAAQSYEQVCDTFLEHENWSDAREATRSILEGQASTSDKCSVSSRSSDRLMDEFSTKVFPGNNKDFLSWRSPQHRYEINENDGLIWCCDSCGQGPWFYNTTPSCIFCGANPEQFGWDLSMARFQSWN